MTSGRCEMKRCRRLKVCNEFGETPDCGPPWSCARFGLPGHDYNDCVLCASTFESYMRKHGMVDPNIGPKGASL